MEQTPITSEQVPEDTVTLKRSHFYSILVVFAFTVGVLFGYVLWGRSAPSQNILVPDQQPAAQAPAPTQDPAEFTRYEIPTEGFPSLGPTDAEIVIVEFSDYQ